MPYTKEEIDFTAKIGAVIMASMSIDAYSTLELHYKEIIKQIEDKRKQKLIRYASNKAADARRSNQTVMDIVTRELTGIIGDQGETVQGVIDSVASTVYDIVDLTETQRNRVNQLIKKLKREESLKKT